MSRAGSPVHSRHLINVHGGQTPLLPPPKKIQLETQRHPPRPQKRVSLPGVPTQESWNSGSGSPEPTHLFSFMRQASVTGSLSKGRGCHAQNSASVQPTAASSSCKDSDTGRCSLKPREALPLAQGHRATQPVAGTRSQIYGLRLVAAASKPSQLHKSRPLPWQGWLGVLHTQYWPFRV